MEFKWKHLFMALNIITAINPEEDVYTKLLRKLLDFLHTLGSKEYDCGPKDSRDPLERVNISELFTSRFIDRNEWGAIQPGGKVDGLQNLPKYVIISHSASSKEAFTEEQCAAEVRSYQTFHIYTKGWSDIGYNFLIGEDGNVYEGRGWGKEGAHTKGLNKYSIGICFIGNFDRRLPNQKALRAAKDLIRRGVKEGKISTNFILMGHRDFRDTVSPGKCLYQDLKTWPFYHGN